MLPLPNPKQPQLRLHGRIRIAYSNGRHPLDPPKLLVHAEHETLIFLYIKGSTNLTKADRIDVRQEIANLAGTGTGNISKVEAIVERAHPNIVVALQNGLLSIHQAWKWCKLSKAQQKEEFARHEEERTRRKILREFSVGESSTSLDPVQVIEALQHKESLEPGSITIRTSLSRRTIIVLGEDLLGAMDAQRELNQIA